MSWVDDYKKKLVSAEEAASLIKSDDRIYISGNAATPYVLMNSLARRKDELEGVELVHVLLLCLELNNNQNRMIALTTIAPECPLSILVPI